MTDVLNALQDRAFLLDAAMNYRAQQNRLYHIKGLLVPAVIDRHDWWLVFGGRSMRSRKQRQRVDFALSHLRKHCSSDAAWNAAIDYLKEHLE